MRRFALALFYAAGLGLADPTSAAEVIQETLVGLDVRTLPKRVPGLEIRGHSTASVPVVLTGKDGRLASIAHPAVAQLHDAGWSPEDPARDGAGEFEVLMATARLVRDHPLAGLVATGNRFGAHQPAMETALRRAVAMGLPVVRTARNGEVQSGPEDLLISAGRLPAAAARRVLTHCLLRYGALPPAADPAHPTAAEVAATRARIRLYQQDFDLASAPLYALQVSERAAIAAMP